jgi:hypothetical protein
MLQPTSPKSIPVPRIGWRLPNLPLYDQASAELGCKSMLALFN